MTPERKFRILCLHGYHGSGDLLRQQMAPLADGLGALAEFVCVDAPTLAHGDFGWWHAAAVGDPGMRGDPGVPAGARRYRGWPAARDFVVSLFEKEGPFDGVFGFSQGSALTGLLVGLRTPDGRPTAQRPLAFDFAMMVSGFVSADPDLAELYDAKESYTLPSVHIIGCSDFVVPPETSRALAAKFEDPLILEHDGGHVVAGTLDVRRRVAAFLQQRLHKPKARVAPPPPSEVPCGLAARIRR